MSNPKSKIFVKKEIPISINKKEIPISINKKEIPISISKKVYDSIEECQCGGPIFKYKDISNNAYVVKCGYLRKVIEIDKDTKKKLWVVPKKSSCNWICVCNGEKPVFKEINKGISTFIQNKVVGDIHKQLEEKLKLLFRFLYLGNHFITLDEINVLVRNNLLREPRKTFLYPSTTLYINKIDESYEDYEKRIFSKKIIDMSYVNYLKYNETNKINENNQITQSNKIKNIKVNGPKYSLNSLFASKKKKENNYELFEENEILEPSLSQFILVDSEQESDNDSEDVESEIDSENEEEQRSDSDNEEYDDKEEIDETASEFENFIDENADNFDDEASDQDYYDD